MAIWTRTLVFLGAMAIWGMYFIVTILRGDDINPFAWGFPGALYAIINPRPAPKKPATPPTKKQVKQDE